ncbi:MAG: tRNA-queuosine alpha-mannosyltransferase domain-containing protein [Bacteroidota bacterium]
MNILLVEPFLGGSHHAFIDGLKAHSRHQIFTVTMKGSHWKWRMSGGAVTLADKTRGIPEQIDLVFASSMTNLPAFIALTNPRFAHVPTVLYMHENQLTQPVPADEERDTTYCYINYLSVLSADYVFFNSKFHKESFLEALPGLLARFPDYQQSESIGIIAAKSDLLYPGLDLRVFDEAVRHRRNRRPNERPVILWNQRWSFDKDPEKFFRVIDKLDDAECTFDLILAGDHQHDKAEHFEQAWKRYGSRILHYGFVENTEQYSRLLQMGDFVLSTSQHEFFCTAIMEAVYCGCHPMLPRDLTYPELMPRALHEPLLHGPVFYDDETDLFRKMKKMLDGTQKKLPLPTLQSINRELDWSRIINRYDTMFENIKTDYPHRQAVG